MKRSGTSLIARRYKAIRDIKLYIPRFPVKRNRKTFLLSLTVSFLIFLLMALGIRVEEPEIEKEAEPAPLEMVYLER